MIQQRVCQEANEERSDLRPDHAAEREALAGPHRLRREPALHPSLQIGVDQLALRIAPRAIFARAAPIAVLTSLASSGGGRTAGIPRPLIQSSRLQPIVWYRCSSSSSSTSS